MASKAWSVNRNPSTSVINPIENVIQLVVDVNDLELNCIESPDYILNALPWKIKLCKSIVDSNNTKRNVVNASLESPFGDYMSKWSCKAGAIFKLFPKNRKNDEIIVKNITKDTFDSMSTSQGIDEIVSWETFLDKYVLENEALFEINISTESPYRKVETELTSVKFHVFAENITKPGIFSSPRVVVRGIHWNVSIGKQGNSLAIYLHADENDMDPNESMEVTATMTLMPMDDSVQPESGQFTRLFGKRHNTNRGFSDLISWDKFIEPNNKFIENDTATFLVELSVGEPKLHWNISK